MFLTIQGIKVLHELICIPLTMEEGIPDLRHFNLCQGFNHMHGGTAALVPPYDFTHKTILVGWNKRSGSTKLLTKRFSPDVTF